MKKFVKVLAIACALSLAAVPAMAASRSGSSSDDSSSSDTYVPGSSSSETTRAVVFDNGLTASVAGATVAADGTVTSGLVSNGTSAAATGNAKRAGLPSTVVATLNAIDAGNLAGVPEAAGKTVLAQTVAITKVTPGSQQQLVMATSKIPASGTVQVLFYDNTTGRFTVIAAVVDPATGVVTFTAPADGTAAIIG